MKKLIYTPGRGAILDSAWLEETQPDGTVTRAGLYQGKRLRAAEAEIAVEREIERLSAQQAAAVQAAQEQQRRERARERRTPPVDRGLPNNSDLPTLFAAGWRPPDRYRVGSHPELEAGS